MSRKIGRLTFGKVCLLTTYYHFFIRSISHIEGEVFQELCLSIKQNYFIFYKLTVP